MTFALLRLKICSLSSEEAEPHLFRNIDLLQ